MKYGSRISKTLRRIAPATLAALTWAGVAQGDQHLTIPCTAGSTYSLALQPSETISALSPYTIDAAGASSIDWSASSVSCAGSDRNWTCAAMVITLPNNPAGTSSPVTISSPGGPVATSVLSITAKDSLNPSSLCTRDFTFHVTTNGGGWGDPHLITVDGTKYDFQSAGEFTTLREKGLEIQTRQTPVPTATVPITNAYTGITHCVAIYTAVAAKFGSTRVTLQPSPGAQPNPKDMELRVNGKLTTLSDTPLIVRQGGGESGKIDATLTRHRDGNYEFTDALGAQLVVTPGYWDAHQVWYLNVNVYGTSAHEGPMGSLAPKSWLPALPDGSSLGAKPASEGDRYQALYEKFADAWRVTDATSLFDYAPGTNTATFTRDEWPRNHPQSCAIEGQTSATAVTDAVAQQACAGITNAAQKADCIFNVKITGNAGFGKTYETMQGFKPRGSGWYSPDPPKGQPPTTCPPQCPTCPAAPPCPPPGAPSWVLILGILQLLLLIIIILLIRSKK